MAKSHTTLSVKIRPELKERFKKLAERQGGKMSGLAKAVIEDYVNESDEPLYCCDLCKKGILANELYYCESATRERYRQKKARWDVFPEDGITLLVLCEKCASKKGEMRKFRRKSKILTHELRDAARVVDLARRA